MANYEVTLRHYIKDNTPSEITHISKPGEDCNAAIASLPKLVEGHYAKAALS
ncbi:hypothetical protein PP754_gp009 [Pectobacterium phage Possum]|uniref:Uncharacterized protein n=1 Tax=Pectobacterium phage Possum TaxID=2686301 RepID=A0A7T0Q0K1_9CAUD|nr:hypothetical protein PP754_gp009 [Pectobacterium phage Possum]QPL10850.1 hypothetical protein Possum_00009 [Pectobacterium phage Possum]QPL10952.1 hypothetical protein Horatius_00009 [Pectobacterium phage Horatius]